MGAGSLPGVNCGWVRAADHSPPSSDAVTHPVGHTMPVTGSLYLITGCMDGWMDNPTNDESD